MPPRSHRVRPGPATEAAGLERPRRETAHANARTTLARAPRDGQAGRGRLTFRRARSFRGQVRQNARRGRRPKRGRIADRGLRIADVPKPETWGKPENRARPETGNRRPESSESQVG